MWQELVDRFEEQARGTQREALRQVMQQPGAQCVFKQRKAMLEPVFARLRGKQKLNVGLVWVQNFKRCYVKSPFATVSSEAVAKGSECLSLHCARNRN